MTDTFARLNTALAGRYQLDRELGAGGMATVYLAPGAGVGRCQDSVTSSRNQEP